MNFHDCDHPLGPCNKNPENVQFLLCVQTTIKFKNHEIWKYLMEYQNARQTYHLAKWLSHSWSPPPWLLANHLLKQTPHPLLSLPTFAAWPGAAVCHSPLGYSGVMLCLKHKPFGWEMAGLAWQQGTKTVMIKVKHDSGEFKWALIIHAWLRRQHVHVMAGRNHAQGPLRSSCKLFLGPDWLREGCAATMAYTEYPSHLPCLLPQVDRTEFNLLTTHSKKLLHGKIQGKTQAQHIREPHAKSASCSNRKCCNVCKLFCTIFFTHIIVVYSCIFSCIVALQAFAGFWCFAWLEFYYLCTRRTCWTKLLFTPILFGRCSSFLHKTNYCRWKQCMKLNLAENAKWFEPNAGLMLTPAHFGNCQSSSWATWHQHQRTTSRVNPWSFWWSLQKLMVVRIFVKPQP